MALAMSEKPATPYNQQIAKALKACEKVAKDAIVFAVDNSYLDFVFHDDQMKTVGRFQVYFDECGPIKLVLLEYTSLRDLCRIGEPALRWLSTCLGNESREVLELLLMFHDVDHQLMMARSEAEIQNIPELKKTLVEIRSQIDDAQRSPSN